MSAGEDPRAAFCEAIRQAGLTPPEAIEPDGKLHRFASNGRRGDDAGWYIFHLDGIPAGAYGYWRSGISETWRADIGRDLTPAELAAHQAKVDAARREREAEDARRKAEAAKQARSVWAAATPLREPHPYLARKGIAAVPELREIHADTVLEILSYRPQCRGETLVGRLLVGRIEIRDEL